MEARSPGRAPTAKVSSGMETAASAMPNLSATSGSMRWDGSGLPRDRQQRDVVGEEQGGDQQMGGHRHQLLEGDDGEDPERDLRQRQRRRGPGERAHEAARGA